MDRTIRVGWVRPLERGEVKDKVSWEELLDSEGRSGDSRWARLITEPESEVEARVRELEQNPPTGGAYVMVVRGERCRDSESLFREWDRAWESFWGTYEFSGDNWDGFGESLAELVEREREDEDPSWGREQPDIMLMFVLQSLELLRDEPGRLRTLVEYMQTAAFGLAWEEKYRPRVAELRILFQCDPGEAEALKQRLAQAGLEL